jgi:hypothetical protein
MAASVVHVYPARAASPNRAAACHASQLEGDDRTMYRLRIVGIAGVLALMVAACSSGPASSPSASATPITSASQSTAPTVAPTASASESESALPSFELPSNAKDLEALLPDELGGDTLQKFSMTGADFMTQGSDNEEFVDFLDRVGAQPQDISVAFAFAATDAQKGIFAFRVKGADSDQLEEEFQKSFETDTPGITWTSDVISGKQVHTATTDADTGEKTFLYVRDDIVFAVIASDDDTAVEAFSKLP